MLEKLNYIFNSKDKGKLLVIMILIVIGSFCELLGVTIFLPFIEIIMDSSAIENSEILLKLFQIFSCTSREDFVVVLAALIASVYIVKNIYLSFMQNTILKFSYNTRMRLATRLLVTYMNEPYTFHLSKNTAELQRCLQVDANQFMQLLNSTLQLLAEVAVALVLGVFLFDTSHSMTIVVGGLLVVCVGGYLVLSKKVSLRLGEQNQKYNAKLIQWINQSLGGIKEVKVLEREDYFVTCYKDNYKKLIKGARINELLVAIPKYIIETVCIVGLIAAIVFKMYFGRREIETFIPQLAAFAIAAFRLLPSVGKINAYINSILYCKPSLDLIYNDFKEIEGHMINKKKKEEDVKKYTFNKEIRLENISYKYPNVEKEVISDVSFSIEKGKTVAFIGSSGSGKTTIVDIILGLLEPQKGRIMIDNWNACDHMSSWHKKIGYIPQTIYLSDDTIRKNIAFGIMEEEIDEKAIEVALKKAQLWDFVNSLPEGLDTFVGDRGVRLSGGQRQRIGIARALYHDPDVLILDEATSALDNETETAVMESIERLQGVKTMLIIAHRLTTIKNVDKIYEVIKGKVIERSKKEVFGE